MRKRYGFTLVELLVVLGIIALLLSILLPSLSMARAHAQSVKCSANLHQYGLAMKMYLNDNRNSFPNANNWLKTSGGYLKKSEKPDGVLWPYLKSMGVHMCPIFAAEAEGSAYRDSAVSYVLNSYLGNGGKIYANWLGNGVTGVTKESQVYNSSKVVLFTEENPWTISGYSAYSFNDTFFTMGNSSRQIDNFATYHNSRNREKGGANVVFVDSHVELIHRIDDQEKSFRLAWPRKTLPY